MAALRARLLGHFGGQELAEHAEADGYRRGQQALAHLGLELLQLLRRDAGEALGELGVVEIDKPDPGQQLQARLDTRARGRLRHDGGPLPR
jgi:hypothetical protein